MGKYNWYSKTDEKRHYYKPRVTLINWEKINLKIVICSIIKWNGENPSEVKITHISFFFTAGKAQDVEENITTVSKNQLWLINKRAVIVGEKRGACQWRKFFSNTLKIPLIL